jgi:hypothetical protein
VLRAIVSDKRQIMAALVAEQAAAIAEVVDHLQAAQKASVRLRAPQALGRYISAYNLSFAPPQLDQLSPIEQAIGDALATLEA